MKLSFRGHYGRSSASTRANGLDNAKELPCPQTNSLIEEIVERNAPQWTALFDAIRAAVIKEFKDELNADLTTTFAKHGECEGLPPRRHGQLAGISLHLS